MASTLPALCKRAIKLFGLIATLPVIALCSCAGGDYWTDRRNDAADVFTLTVGTGLGAKVRAGPLHAGLFVGEDAYGLRGGTWGSQETRMGNVPVPVDIDILVLSMETYRASNSYARNKNFCARGVPLLCGVESYDSSAYYTQIEATVGLVGELRVGVNPGELLDFLLGFTTLDIYGDDVRWKTRFVRAVADGDMGKFTELLRRGANVNAVVNGTTALHVAVSNGQEAVTRALIAAGADVNATSIEGATPLHRACSLRSDVAQRFVGFLLEHGANVEVADMFNRTPLFYAVESANSDVVRQLLSRKANPNIRNFSRETPLKLAQEKGLTEIADLLREHGATE